SIFSMPYVTSYLRQLKRKQGSIPAVLLAFAKRIHQRFNSRQEVALFLQTGSQCAEMTNKFTP
ncbi:MAG: hypothetical protein L0I35_08005, partial [Hafniaceae bacterium]|nr:hypothetical protein [Hafniaceae bacterium]